ncbi:hypothetical protein CLM62_11655 [Streptomyces sp. SA15]|nr:hypothetical protein CLM62_11655 [Streptomyces sp. SA15]
MGTSTGHGSYDVRVGRGLLHELADAPTGSGDRAPSRVAVLHPPKLRMVFAAELGGLAGLSDDAVVRRHRSVLSAVGLPLHHRGGRWPDLLEAMRVDKKSRGNTPRFIVLDGIGRTRVLKDPAPDRLAAAWARVSG